MRYLFFDLSRFIHKTLVCSLIFTSLNWGGPSTLSAEETPLSNGVGLEEMIFAPLNIEIAALLEQTQEEAPSIVSVVGRKEIEAYGARDLADVLRMVPGFEFGIDVFSNIGLGFRGIWVHEGKALLMIDGIRVNDFGFGNFNYIGSLPTSFIERVEIIRGPGSALYGDFAEVAVINVVSQKGKNINGFQFKASAGTLGSGETAYDTNFAFGHHSETTSFSGHIGSVSRPLSKRVYRDFFGNKIEQGNENSYRRWQHTLLESSIHNFKLNYHRTRFDYLGQDGFVDILPKVNGINQEEMYTFSEAMLANYEFLLFDKVKVKPRVEIIKSNPAVTAVLASSVLSDFLGPGLTLFQTHSQILMETEAPGGGNLTLGGGYISDTVESISKTGLPGLFGSADRTNHVQKKSTLSRFGLAQYIHKLGPFGLTLGGRYEDTSFGSALAPRIGLTYVEKAFNAKLLHGRAFRIPLTYQAFSRLYTDPGEDLDPELARTTEVELGYRLTENTTAKVNAFLIDIDQPIVYDGATNSYINLGRIQSSGVEGEFRFDKAKYGGFVNASYAKPGSKTSTGFMTDSKKDFVGLPRIKANLGAYTRMGFLKLVPSLTYLSSRAGQSQRSALSAVGLMETVSHKSIILTNLNIIGANLADGLDVHLTVQNMFNTRYLLIQTYYGAHAPMPVNDRQISLGITWHI